MRICVGVHQKGKKAHKQAVLIISKRDLVLNRVAVGYPPRWNPHLSIPGRIPLHTEIYPPLLLHLVGTMCAGGPRRHEVCAALLSRSLDAWMTPVSVSTAESSAARGKAHGIISKPVAPYVTSYASTWVAKVRDVIETRGAGIPQFRLGASTPHYPPIFFDDLSPGLWRQLFDVPSYQRFFETAEEAKWKYVLPVTIQVSLLVHTVRATSPPFPRSSKIRWQMV